MDAPELVLGPLLRFVGPREATVWVETSRPAEVEVRPAGGPPPSRERTFSVAGHHYALVTLRGLEPGSSCGYEVLLDGRRRWPPSGGPFPPPLIRTPDPSSGRLRLAFGSCRVSVPHEPPYTLRRGSLKRGGVLRRGFYERDALYALALRMRGQPPGRWPDALLMLGDQIYADEVSPQAKEFIRSRRDTSKPPGEQVADFEEYTRLYLEAWRTPAIRWLLSTVPSAMIFDDHDVHDDWNTSEAWVRKMRSKPWWEERIVGAFMSYWVYQHLGNLSPAELEEDPLFAKVRGSRDATQTLRGFARAADRDVAANRWSFRRDFGRVRLVVADSRAGRVLSEGRRAMLDEAEWAWIEEQVLSGGFDHLLFATSLPFVLSPGLHHLEAASEAVCGGAWGRAAARAGEAVRQALDLEHWSAFGRSFAALSGLLRRAASGEGAPASIAVLSGDVHHGYLAALDLGPGARSPAYQAVGSPIRNPLGLPERLALRAAWTRAGAALGRGIARLAGVGEPPVGWRLLHQSPWFDNHISTLSFEGRRATLLVEKTTPEDGKPPKLLPILERRLA
ncbi:conserved hypothetical protein [Rubrobacter xylanophilus DSM 9941]|uniref:Uncharacterized protein n=1 Tax=Rubrobacter xylanophilus (strain DSM 9941 / JCM 11954 / NBRC 16129 / PRD-1) TaxID=266117 RepID=Q1AZQ0_RUBXD|nr:alkaline phosphatase D family protein [Rubrobacter xylanophilus]ABG03128.1 conserved hypothetical protein [Rubrobacter xylanophilus DSM 9941]